MKKVFLIAFLIFYSGDLISQILKPVNRTVTSKKIKAKTYEVHLKATLNKGWHLYSQFTPEGGPVATKIRFTKNSLFDLDGKTKEIGKLEEKHEDLFGVDVKQFSNTVDFIQVIKLKAPVKTFADVLVEYMVCDDKQCLPPAIKKFSIELK